MKPQVLRPQRHILPIVTRDCWPFLMIVLGRVTVLIELPKWLSPKDEGPGVEVRVPLPVAQLNFKKFPPKQEGK